VGWRAMDVREQRVQFVVAALRGERTLSSLCREFEISRPTGRLWVQRYRAGGVEGIAEKSRRPQRSPTQTASGLEQRVVELRGQYPDWGARKLQRVLAEKQDVRLTVSTIHRILLRHDLVRDEDRHPAATRRFERSAPNELWQMDFKGPKNWHQPVGPLAILDDHSRYAIALEALGTTKAEPVRERLRAAFMECGLPQAMLMDHGVPWWSWAGPEAASTGLAVWLMKQGIRLLWSGIRHPQTQGKVERFNGSLQRALDKRGLGAKPPPWACRLPLAAGNLVHGAMTLIRHAGSTRKGPGCSRSTVRASSISGTPSGASVEHWLANGCKCSRSKHGCRSTTAKR
jgi:transposase InsO family protein